MTNAVSWNVKNIIHKIVLKGSSQANLDREIMPAIIMLKYKMVFSFSNFSNPKFEF
jgi:hypothetical protein